VSMRSVIVALRVLEEIAAHQPVGVSELARLMKLSKTTVHRSLMTLKEADWIEPADDGRAVWSLSARALVVGGRAVDSHSGLRSIAVPVMEDLRRATEETIHLLVRERRSVVLIERLDGIKPVRVFNPVGGRSAMHRTSAGKAIMARLADDEIEAYSVALESPRPGSPSFDLEQFRAELRTVRERGFAINLGNNQPDVHAVAGAIIGAGERAIAAITISAPPERLPLERCLELGPLVADAARRIALGLRARRQPSQ
jgi:IclR family acetate operon transcriptional repressor